jgi:predicted AlkP superfamily pyrophosphatase or phosphodiesterase
VQAVRSKRVAIVAVAAALVATGGAVVLDAFADETLAFEAQLCGLPQEWLEVTRRGYNEPRSGQITLLPDEPIYMSTGSLGWTHSGPWGYLQNVPLVFYGPGRVPEGVEVDRTVTIADVAPTFAEMLPTDLGLAGDPLSEVFGARRPPRLIVTVVWDGGGWNGLEQWPDAWPQLKGLMRDGVSFTDAIVGSSPSVTPAVHTTLGTGVFPDEHGVTGVPVRDENGTVVDSFNDGKSARFIEVPTVAEAWDEAQGNEALVGMIGYEPWHLGMIGKGAEAPGGDNDDAVWVNRGSNRWVTNRSHYAIPATFRDQSDLADRLQTLDTSDGDDDDRWERVPLDEQSRIEETPAFVAHHGQKLVDLIGPGGYGDDEVTDFLFTNFKQIDRVAHYFNMDAPEVEDVMEATDAQLAVLVEELEAEVGHGKYVVVVTADHGMQPDEDTLDTYAIDPNETERDITARFGPVVRAVWPTEVFLLEDEMAARGVTVEDVARFLGEYRMRDNTSSVAKKVLGSGDVGANTRLFELAAPAAMLETVSC